ncbi:septation regulator SpoVG [Pseudoramibacter sp.]|jgi:stage V sporulation protein G|uniref:septation regulator SpoVG n=1 Tax=Pseudoramibacter sp. TaxID=2034862 RepID=UPI0025FBEA15|nr:septation regulator SpoVG [Pseudoramibacter sp.]MCH4071499.1 septation regulator SpoVG [Pseudoramibacter sp.]MCH4105267.1 septation regulator SpoVG [Pseudoramibacter sp.]
MTITDIRVRKIYSSGKMRGIVSVTFDDEFVVHDIKVIEGQNGFFIAMPSRKTPEGEFKDICHPIKSEMRKMMQDAVLEAYDKAVEAQKEEEEAKEREDVSHELEVDYEDE